MSIPATTDFSNPDPSIKFTTVGALVNLLRTLVSTVLPNDLKPYVTGSATPAVDDQDKVWMRTAVGGQPLGTWMFYSGMWRKQFTGLGSEMKIFYGDPASAFDGTGLGIVGGNWDGWQIMNGMNGTSNLSNRFLIGGEMDNVGFTGFSGGSWRSNILGIPLQQGGVPFITLDATNTYSPATTEVTVGDWQADGGQARNESGSGPLYGTIGDGTHSMTTLVAANAGMPTPADISTTPPFFAVCFCQWAGYDGVDTP